MKFETLQRLYSPALEGALDLNDLTDGLLVSLLIIKKVSLKIAVRLILEACGRMQPADIF